MENYEDYREVYELYNDMPPKVPNPKPIIDLESQESSQESQKESVEIPQYYYFLILFLFAFVLILSISLCKNSKDDNCSGNFIIIFLTYFYVFVLFVFGIIVFVEIFCCEKVVTIFHNLLCTVKLN